MNPNFEANVNRIYNDNTQTRMTFKDDNYLRDPVKTPMEREMRLREDRRKRMFESTKQALDLEKTQYMVRQSEAVANQAEEQSKHLDEKK